MGIPRTFSIAISLGTHRQQYLKNSEMQTMGPQIINNDDNITVSALLLTKTECFSIILHYIKINKLLP